MSQQTVFTNGRIVTADAVVSGSLRIAGGVIVGLDEGRSRTAGAIDLEGDLLLPGLVELHTDNLERNVAPRPGVTWPGLAAALAHDAQLAAAGITTVFDALALGDLNPASARVQSVKEMAEAIRAGCERRHFRAEHFLHLRCELSYEGVLGLFDRMTAEPRVRLVSLMDHTPGQRQFADIGAYRRYYQGKYALSDAALNEFVVTQREAHLRYAVTHRAAIVAACRQRGLAIASHDDATAEHVAEAHADGAAIAEFPTTECAAAAARSRGMRVLMGAPNLVLGRSHSGNVSAQSLAARGLLDILSSDYVPASLLHAAFLLHRIGCVAGLPAAVAMVSRIPAAAAGLADRGEIAPGRRADLVRVRDAGDPPLVLGVWREGTRVI